LVHAAHLLQGIYPIAVKRLGNPKVTSFVGWISLLEALMFLTVPESFHEPSKAVRATPSPGIVSCRCGLALWAVLEHGNGVGWPE
jgi:hypothetical protein